MNKKMIGTVHVVIPNDKFGYFSRLEPNLVRAYKNPKRNVDVVFYLGRDAWYSSEVRSNILPIREITTFKSIAKGYEDYPKLNRENLLDQILPNISDGDYITFIDVDDSISDNYFVLPSNKVRNRFIIATGAKYVVKLPKKGFYASTLRSSMDSCFYNRTLTVNELYEKFLECVIPFQIWGYFFPVYIIREMVKREKENGGLATGMWEDLVHWSTIHEYVPDFTITYVPAIKYYYNRIETSYYKKTIVTDEDSYPDGVNNMKRIGLDKLELLPYEYFLIGMSHIQKLSKKLVVDSGYTNINSVYMSIDKILYYMKELYSYTNTAGWGRMEGRNIRMYTWPPAYEINNHIKNNLTNMVKIPDAELKFVKQFL